MTQSKVLVCKFLSFKSYAIHKMSKFNENSNGRIAFSRKDGSVEIWFYFKKTQYWHNEVIFKGVIDCLIESLIWLKTGTLLMGDTSGKLTEWRSFAPLVKTDVYNCSQEITCMDYQPKKDLLLVSCQREVMLFNTEALTFEKKIVPSNDYICCVKFHPTQEQFLFVTVAAEVGIYNLTNNSILSVKDSSKSDGNLIWSCLFLSNFTVILGDSNGNIEFIDGLNAISASSTKCFKGVVIDMCMSPNEDFFAACSADKTVSYFVNHPKKGFNFKKVEFHHSNDVNCVSMDAFQNIVVSGGSDGLCKCYQIKDEELVGNITFGTINHISQFKCSYNSNRIMQLSNRFVSVYESFFENKQPIYLLQVNNETQFDFVEGGISDCGEYIAVSTARQYYVYQLLSDYHKRDVTATKLSILPIQDLPFICCCFSKNSTFLAILTTTLDCVLIHLKQMIIFSTLNVNLQDFFVFGKCDLIYADSDCFFLISRCSPGRVKQIDFENNNVREICFLDSIIVNHALIPGTSKLIILGYDMTIFLLDLSSGIKLSCYNFKRKVDSNEKLVQNMFYYEHKNRIILQTMDALMWFNVADFNSDRYLTFNRPNQLKKQYIPLKYNFKYRPIFGSGSFKNSLIFIVIGDLEKIYTDSNLPMYIPGFKKQ